MAAKNDLDPDLVVVDGLDLEPPPAFLQNPLGPSVLQGFAEGRLEHSRKSPKTTLVVLCESRRR